MWLKFNRRTRFYYPRIQANYGVERAPKTTKKLAADTIVSQQLGVTFGVSLFSLFFVPQLFPSNSVPSLVPSPFLNLINQLD